MQKKFKQLTNYRGGQHWVRINPIGFQVDWVREKPIRSQFGSITRIGSNRLG